MTTKDAIKLMPLDDDIKIQILKMYDYMEPEQKAYISKMAWQTYDLLRDARIEAGIEDQYEKARKGEEKLDENFFDTLVKQTDQVIAGDLSQASGNVDLAHARQAMQQIIKEMQDAQLAKKSNQQNKKNN